jgi:hypothetical protein
MPINRNRDPCTLTIPQARFKPNNHPGVLSPPSDSTPTTL